jgi:hypothetical protein
MPAPMLDDLELTAVQLVRQETEQDYRRRRIAGLEGTFHQHLGRRSHRVVVGGLLLPPTAADDLATLQKKAASGEEVTFTADISTALNIERMVIESFAAEQGVGVGGQTAYAILLSESPPLPPPAEVAAFGGLDDFGVGDLGFDPGALGDVLSDIADQAGSVMAMADAAMGAIDGLKDLAKFAASLADLANLANLANLGDIGNPAQPVVDALGTIDELAPLVQSITDASATLAG